MITVTKKNDAEIAPMELAGRSTDEKPVGEYGGYPIINASTFFEMDTGDLYWFDEDTGEWIK